MTSDNVFSDWLTSLVTFFAKTLYSTRKKSREVNITFQRLAPYETKENVVIKAYLRVKSICKMCHIIQQLMTFNSMETRIY